MEENYNPGRTVKIIADLAAIMKRPACRTSVATKIRASTQSRLAMGGDYRTAPHTIGVEPQSIQPDMWKLLDK